MKLKKTNFSVAISFLFAATLLFICVLQMIEIGIDGAKVMETYDNDTYTVCTNEEYYSETTYYFTESAYNKRLRTGSKDDSETQLKARALSMVTQAENEESNTEFVLAASKRVWTYEETNEDGVVVESRLLTKSEIEQLECESVSNSTGVALLSATEIGSDSEDFYYLDINMTVYYNTDSGEYEVSSTASWEKIFLLGASGLETAEEFCFDCIGITWGGNGALVATEKDTFGYYYNGNKLSIARSESESYGGIFWQFQEKSGFLGSELENVTVGVSLQRKEPLQGKETNIKMTYIHTYGKINGEIEFKVDSSGEAAASLKLTKVEKQWQIQIDVPRIAY